LSSRLPAPPRSRPFTPALALVLALAGASFAAPRAHALETANGTRTSAVKTCPLGSLFCPRRPLSYAACRPNALLDFYVHGLPTDSRGRKDAMTDVLARRVDSSNRSLYVFDGDVRLQRYDQLLRADQVRYNDTTTAYDASGHVRLQDSSLLLSASRIKGTTRPEKALAEDVRYQLLQSRGNGIARSARLLDAQHSKMHQATYSTCDPGDRVWEFRAARIDLDKQTGEGTARNATLRYHGVPILYLPYISFPIDHRRKTGLLYPTFGNSSRNGFTYSQPLYLNLAPNYDATLAPRLMTRRGVMLDTQFRYLTSLGTGQLVADYLPHDRNAGYDSAATPRSGIRNGDRRYFVQFRNHSGLGAQWGFDTLYQRASDVYYFRDFGSDLSNSAISVLASNAYLRGQGQWWNAALGVDSYQSMDPQLPDTSLQYRRWPRGVFDLDIPITRDLDFGLDSEAVAFRRVRSIEGNRLDLQPYLSWTLAGAAWFVKPRIAYRYTRYDLIGDYNRYVTGTPFPQRTPSREMPIYSLDSGLYFERDVHWFGHHYTQTLEPRLYYLYVPYRNQDNLPIFDTRLLTFDFWQLFTTNRFSGADRQMDADNLTGAVTSRLLDDNGNERASFSFGQIHYFRPQRVQLARYALPTDYRGSAYVAQGSLSLNDRWRLDSAYQWSPNDRHSQVATLGLQRRIGGDGIFNFAYRYRFRFLEQLDVSAVYPVSPRWRLLGRWNVALRDIYNPQVNPGWTRGQPKTIEALAGVEYDSCCTAIRVIGRHYVRDTLGHTANAIMLEIEFKGLGSTTPQTEAFLQRAILGYQ